jgi:hypothetical protein
MTSKEQAAKLRYLFSKELDLKTTDVKVLQCALIAVNLSLEFCGGKDMNEEFDKVLYLVEVKNEIEKL